MSFTEIGFREDKLVRLDIKINGEDAPPLATIVNYTPFFFFFFFTMIYKLMFFVIGASR